MASTLKYYTGSAWTAKPLKYWTGSAWTTKQLKYWNGSAWIGAAAGGPPYLDSFNRADASLEASATASGGWSWAHDGLIASAMQIVSNQLRCNTALSAGSTYKTPDLGVAAHWVQYKPQSLTMSTGPAACCRLADNNNWIGIRAGNGGANGQIEVVRRITAAIGVLYSSATGAFAVGDVLRLECSADVWTLKKNGATVTTGAIGVALTSTRTGVVARAATGTWADDFEAGAL